VGATEKIEDVVSRDMAKEARRLQQCVCPGEMSTDEFDVATLSPGGAVTYRTSYTDFTATAKLSETQAIVCSRRANTYPRGVCELLTLNGEAAPTPRSTSSSIYGGGAGSGCEISVAALSATSAVVCSNNCGAHYCHGLTVSGNTLSVGPELPTGESYRAKTAMRRVDATRAILCWFSSSNSYRTACAILKQDPAENILMMGSTLLLPQSNGGQHYRPKQLTMLSPTTALLSISYYSHLDYNGAVIEITGETTLGLMRTGYLSTSPYNGIEPRVATVDANTVINCFGDDRSRGGGTFCVVVDVSTSGFSRGTYLQLESRNHGNNGMDMTSIGSGAAVVCWRGVTVISGGGYGGNCLAVKAVGTELRPSPLSGQTVSQFMSGTDGAGGDGESLSLSGSPMGNALYCYSVSSTGRCRMLTLAA